MGEPFIGKSPGSLEGLVSDERAAKGGGDKKYRADGKAR